MTKRVNNIDIYYEYHRKQSYVRYYEERERQEQEKRKQHIVIHTDINIRYEVCLPLRSTCLLLTRSLAYKSINLFNLICKNANKLEKQSLGDLYVAVCSTQNCVLPIYRICIVCCFGRSVLAFINRSADPQKRVSAYQVLVLIHSKRQDKCATSTSQAINLAPLPAGLTPVHLWVDKVFV